MGDVGVAGRRVRLSPHQRRDVGGEVRRGRRRGRVLVVLRVVGGHGGGEGEAGHGVVTGQTAATAAAWSAALLYS